jgi:hypothetical protein
MIRETPHGRRPSVLSNCDLDKEPNTVMKKYLQNCKTLRFIRCDSLWTAELIEALDFISIRRAPVYGLKGLI